MKMKNIVLSAICCLAIEKCFSQWTTSNPTHTTYDVGISGYVDLGGNLHTRQSLYTLNKAGDGWLPWAQRNLSGSEATLDLYNLGNASFEGNVGVGISTPATKFHVKDGDVVVGETRSVATFAFGGWNHFENDNQTSTEGKIVLGSQAFNNGVIKRAEVGFASSGNWQTGGRLNFYTTPDNQTWIPVRRMTIDHSGNVGIGVTNPAAKLEVDGTIISEEVKVQIVTGPDYVFEPDYALPTLEETKAYIDANKHLPEIPSAKEMEENGVALGEMNMLLLRKIEELTLYVIQQNEIIAQLKEERTSSPDPSGKEIEELTLYIIQQEERIKKLEVSK